MSVGNNSDGLKAAAEKLKKLADDIQEQYESFVDATQLYKKGNINQQDFMPRLADYLIRSTSLNIGAIEVLLELKVAVEKKLSKAAALTNERPMKVPSNASLPAPTLDSTKSATVRTCHSCGSAISLRAKFCNKCGKSQ